jgi:transposase
MIPNDLPPWYTVHQQAQRWIKVGCFEAMADGFILLPRRWVAERSFAWVARSRRLVRDYERLPSSLAGLHWRAFLSLMLNALFQNS